jgi:hypothetical protein
MKITGLSTVLQTMRGEPIKEGNDPMTLKDVMVNALNMTPQDERIDGKEKQKRYHLAGRIWMAGDEIDLTSDEVVLVKNLIAKVYASALVVGQAWDMIEPPAEKK